MDREVVLSVLAVLIAGPALLLGGALPARRIRIQRARELERAAWARLWRPLVPTAIALAGLVGWALSEPANSERIPTACFLAASPFLLLWCRTARRAFRALTLPRERQLIATVGLFRPRILVSPRLDHVLDPQSFRAAIAHEQAHLRHRDPLRLWLAQLATDSQWPWPSARARYVEWRLSLELARDEEARARGIDGVDLASAILKVAGVSSAVCGEGAGFLGDGQRLRERIARLLCPIMPENAGSPSVLPWALLLAVVAALFAGAAYGEPVVRAFLGERW